MYNLSRYIKNKYGYPSTKKGNLIDIYVWETMNPFNYVNSINLSKKDIMITPEDEKAYNSFMVNRSLSYFSDTAVIANEMNRYHHLDSRLQYSFLINIIRKRKRFSKWVKPELEHDL